MKAGAHGIYLSYHPKSRAVFDASTGIHELTFGQNSAGSWPNFVQGYQRCVSDQFQSIGFDLGWAVVRHAEILW